MPDQLRDRDGEYAAKASEKGPLLGRKWKNSDGKVHRNSWSVLIGWLKHSLIHAFMFGTVSVLFMVGYHQNPYILTGIFGFLFVALLVDAIYTSYSKNKGWKVTKETVGFTVCAFAILIGAVVGTSLHLTKLIDYWPYYQKRHYTNVAPDEPAASHADASVLVFMKGARPDTSRSMGYSRYNSIYCVAPIALEAGYADEQAASSDIQYWAVGKDCCGGRKGFTCDDAKNSAARSGLVLNEKTDEDALMKGVMSSNEMDYYRKAVLMTQSKFDLTSPKEHLYVRFVEDIEKARMGYWADAWWSWAKYQIIGLGVWMIVGVLTIVVGAGDPEDADQYSEHIVDAKMTVLYRLNHLI